MSPKTIILTGASRGIGLAIAHFLLEKGHRLIVTARSRAPLDELREKYSGRVEIVVGDAADPRVAEDLRDRATKWDQGKLDGLILNHGALEPVTRIADADLKAWRTAFDVNFFSYVGITQACLPLLRQSKGNVIFTSSGAAAFAYSTWGAYGSAKAALNQLAQTLAREEPSITTISIRPGVVDTDMQKGIREQHASIMDKDKAERFIKLKESGQLLKPEQPGHVMARLVLNAPNDLNGEFISWDDERLKKFQDE
ncbi:hypothetical protein ANO11243_021450 [Dothideomycetidae sp. 11243]|nr:hypothetical protein ANO11243_021450 [fungal sp. No.11243]